MTKIGKKELSGVFPALLTPFDENGKINDKALADLIELNLKKGVKGFYVGGSTAEFLLMSKEERKHILDVAVETVKGRGIVISHVGSVSTADAVELAGDSEKVGADVVSAVAPFYYKYTFDEIQSYYFDIAAHTSLPMLVYYFPAFSDVTFSNENIRSFMEKEQFCGIKFTSNDFFKMERIHASFPDKVVFNGYDEMFLAGLSMGADGGIGSTYNFMAEKFIKMQKLFSDGKIEEAQKIQDDVNKIISALVQVGVTAGEKEILNALGINLGRCRLPFKMLDNEQRNYLLDVALPLLQD